MDFKELFDKLKSFKINFSDVNNKQNEFLNKINNIKIGKKNTEQKR